MGRDKKILETCQQDNLDKMVNFRIKDFVSKNMESDEDMLTPSINLWLPHTLAQTNVDTQRHTTHLCTNHTQRHTLHRHTHTATYTTHTNKYKHTTTISVSYLSG